MADHIKPTQEELDANITKSIEELDKIEGEKKAEEVVVEEKVDEIQSDQEETTTEEETTEDKEVEGESEESEKEEDSTDYKKKFSESSKESQKLYAKNRKLDQAIDEANELPEPTDEDLQQSYTDWEIMSDTEKLLAKESLINKRFRERLAKAREESRKIEQWEKSVDDYIDNPQTFIDNPDMEGKQTLFKSFAAREENNSVPFKTLVNAFLYEQTKNAPAKKKGKMFETGVGGPNDAPKTKSDKLSVADSRLLAQTDYKKYSELLRAGKIASE